MSDTYLNPKYEKMLPPGVNSWTDPSNNEAFIAGTLAYTNNAGTMYAKAQFDKVPFADQIRVIPMPQGGKDVKPLEGAGAARFNLFTGVKNKDASYAMMAYLLAPEQMRPLYKTSTGYVVPVWQKQWDDPIVQADENNKRFQKVAWREPQFLGVSHPAPPSPATDAVSRQNLATDMMGQVLKGKKVEDAVKEMHDRAVKIFKEFGLKGE
jgi:multiple sugar transport system substrate-binding protein